MKANFSFRSSAAYPYVMTAVIVLTALSVYWVFQILSRTPSENHVRAWISAYAIRPHSVSYLEWSKPVDDLPDGGHVIGCKFQAADKDGNIVDESKVFELDGSGNVITVTDWTDSGQVSDAFGRRLAKALEPVDKQGPLPSRTMNFPAPMPSSGNEHVAKAEWKGGNVSQIERWMETRWIACRIMNWGPLLRDIEGNFLIKVKFVGTDPKENDTVYDKVFKLNYYGAVLEFGDERIDQSKRGYKMISERERKSFLSR